MIKIENVQPPKQFVMNERKCLECSEPLRGRADQKFCNDQCRSSYNNRQFIETNNVIRAINRILKKNYAILAALNPEGKTTALKSELHKKGYRFDYYTGNYTARNGRFFYFCYDHGYAEIENNKVILVTRDLNSDLTSMKPISEKMRLGDTKNLSHAI